MKTKHRAPAGRAYPFESILGDAPPMKSAVALLRKIAVCQSSTVLLLGESGTGKGLTARVLHANSPRAGKPFMQVTCSTLPEPLLESELFGHERGAFTDAKQQKKGLLEMADGGTVFFDEIGEMPPTLQAKLLQFLEDKTFKRVGGTSELKVDVRVIAATNRDLFEAVGQGIFRRDLYYRLKVMSVTLPPLREHKDDLRIMARHFIQEFNRQFEKQIRGLTPEALDLLTACSWPGNVREFRNAIEQALLLADGDWLTPASFRLDAEPQQEAPAFVLPPGGIHFERLERELVSQALQRANGNYAHAGRLLGMDRHQIRYRAQKFALDRYGRPLPSKPPVHALPTAASWPMRTDRLPPSSGRPSPG